MGYANHAVAADFGDSEININDVANATVTGSAGASLGERSLQRVEDANGDGIADMVASGASGAYILFGSKHPSSWSFADEVPPSRGYRITPPSNGVYKAFSLGDINGDGISDIGLNQASNLVVVYGLTQTQIDGLPTCAGATQTRCLSIPALTAANYAPTPPAAGFRVTGGRLTSNSHIGNVGGGDFDGDGVNELAVPGPAACACVYVLEGNITPANGVLSLSAGPIPADAVTISGAPSPLGPFGNQMNFVGDVNHDGKDDLAVMSPPIGDEGSDASWSMYIVYGKDADGALDVTTLPSSSGLRFSLPESIGIAGSGALYRLDDGSGPAVDLASENKYLIEGVGSSEIAVFGNLPSTLTGPLAMFPPDADKGYTVKSSDLDATGQLMTAGSSGVGDLDGNGVGDLAQGVPDLTVEGNASAGRATVFLSKAPPAADPVFGPATDGDEAVTLVGSAGQRIGTNVMPLGDIDNDGLADVAVAGGDTAGTTAGAVYIVLGRSLFAQAQTSKAANVADKTATLAGVTLTNGRNSDARFEYGPTKEYGSSTSAESVTGSDSAGAVEADVSGLQPETTYHYRLAVTNDLGLTRYGADRTFATGATPPGPPDPPCTADPTQPGCPEYNYCQDPAHANEQGCQTPVARLSGLIASPTSSKVKRGKKTTVTATIVNTGGAAASGVRICASGPKKLVSVKKSCVSVGSLESGASKTVKFTVAVKRRAKRGGKAGISLSATATGLDKRSAKVTVRVR